MAPWPSLGLLTAFHSQWGCPCGIYQPAVSRAVYPVIYSGVPNVGGSGSKPRGRTGPLWLGQDSDGSGACKNTDKGKFRHGLTRVRGRDSPGQAKRRPAGPVNHGKLPQTGSCPWQTLNTMLPTENRERQLSSQALPIQESQAQCRELGFCTFCV
jgi:hypothetical protein